MIHGIHHSHQAFSIGRRFAVGEREAVDLAAVDVRPVGAAHVPDPPPPFGPIDLGVDPADLGILDAEAAGRVSPDAKILDEDEVFTLSGPAQDPGFELRMTAEDRIFVSHREVVPGEGLAPFEERSTLMGRVPGWGRSLLSFPGLLRAERDTLPVNGKRRDQFYGQSSGTRRRELKLHSEESLGNTGQKGLG